MRRLLPLLMSALLAVTGCAVKAPTSPVSASATPPGLVVGSDGSAGSALIAAIYAEAFGAVGRPARVAPISGQVNKAVPEVAAGRVNVAPIFAGTALDQMAAGITGSASDLVGQLAAELEGEVSVIKESAVDNRQSFAVPASSATRLVSLADLARRGLVAAAPRGWGAAPSGLSLLAEAYGLRPGVTELDLPVDRVAALLSGSARLAVFRGTEDGVPTEATAAARGVRLLTDPEEMIQPDPQSVLVNQDTLADDQVVEVLQKVQAALSNVELNAIRARAAAIGEQPAIQEWLRANGVS